jgi:hypothetical protein
MAQRCLCIAFVKWQNRHRVFSVTRTAEALHQRLDISSATALEMLEHMINAGTRFLNLEKHVGEGISIVLGQGSETRYHSPTRYLQHY